MFGDIERGGNKLTPPPLEVLGRLMVFPSDFFFVKGKIAFFSVSSDT